MVVCKWQDSIDFTKSKIVIYIEKGYIEYKW
jgi:hypothetical protein